jgi:precorrin-6B methylase 2
VYLPIVASQRLGKYPLIVATQRLGRNVAAVTNTLAKIEELLEVVVFNVARVVSRKAGDWFLPELPVLILVNEIHFSYFQGD